MCRLFGFRSIILSQVHQSLVEADNALGTQSINNPDGWGVAYYLGSTPHLIKSDTSAITCDIFKKVSGVVTSHSVIAHIRKSTIGKHSILNTHPFQFANWVFAHNGNIKNFSKYRNKLEQLVSKKLKKYILGETDSELLFFIIMSFIGEKYDLINGIFEIEKVARIIKYAINKINDIIGPSSEIDNAGEDETYLTFILSNGDIMLSHKAGKHLHYSTYKNRCADRDRCSSFAEMCEAPTKDGYINHLIFSSEPLSGENIWLRMENNQMIGTDKSMKLFISK